MSSVYVRDQVATFIASNLATETLVDLTNEIQDLQTVLNDSGVTYEDDWLGIQFIGSDEIPVSILATNSTGKYRETGALFLHIVTPAKQNNVTNILTRSETIRNAFRGQRINDIVIESVTPPNFESGQTLQFDDGFTSASVIVNYYRDLSL